MASKRDFAEILKRAEEVQMPATVYELTSAKFSFLMVKVKSVHWFYQFFWMVLMVGMTVEKLALL